MGVIRPSQEAAKRWPLAQSVLPPAPLPPAPVPPAPVPMPSALWSILYQRGLQNQHQVEQHFTCSFKNLRSPYLLHGMQQAVDLLEAAQQKHICIYADFDMDGTPGLALLLDGLRGLGYQNISYIQPLRLSQGYGVHIPIVEKLAARGVEILITLDIGITDTQALARAQQLGLQVIVTDHHLPKAELPPADAIVDPNTQQCSSGLGHLCGAGVAFYLLLALRMRLKSNFNLKPLLDGLAIATITDCVPLIDENRILVKHGLLQLQHTQRPGLAALLQVLGLEGRPLNAQDVAFKLAPKLNALSRMEEEGLKPLDIFLTRDPVEAGELARRACEVHKKRVHVQSEAEQELNARPLKQVNFVWEWSENFHPGVVGLLATRMAEQHRVPAFVGVQKGDRIVGSARAFKNEHILQALEFSSEALLRFGGHAQAAGFELHTHQAPLLEQKLQHVFGVEKKHKPIEFYYDAQLQIDDLTEEFMCCYEAMGPFGMGFQAPVFYMQGVRVLQLKILGGGHLRLHLERPNLDGVSRFVPGLYFVPKGPALLLDYQQKLQQLQVGGRVDLLAEPQWNYFRGHRSLQLRIHQLAT